MKLRIPFALTLVGVALVVGAIGLTLNPYFSFVLTRLMIYVIATLGLNILMGYAGQLAFAHAAMFGIGAYVTGLCQVRLGWPFAPSMLAAVVFTTIVGALLTLPALRLSGLYLALSTLAIAQAVQWAFLNWTTVTYGAGGFRVPEINLGFGLNKTQSVFLVTLVVTLVLAILADNILRSRFGRQFVAIRGNAVAAASMGVNVTQVKVIAFSLSAAFAAAAGALFSALLGFVSPESFDLNQMVLMQIMVVVGGLGSLIGSLIGPMVVIVLLELLRDTRGLMEVIFGVILIGFVLFQPKGLAAIFASLLKLREPFIPRSLSGLFKRSV